MIRPKKAKRADRFGYKTEEPRKKLKSDMTFDDFSKKMEQTTRYESKIIDDAKRKEREAKFGKTKPVSTAVSEQQRKRAEKFGTNAGGARPGSSEASINRQNTFKKNITSHLSISV